jgi:hypothetical protein
MGRTYRVRRKAGPKYNGPMGREKEQRKEWVRNRALELRELRREKD